MARPKIKIDPIEVLKLAQIGCKNEEIATWFDVSAQTIERRFRPELAKGRSNMKISLRRLQLQAAHKGNVTMLIWLGKQYLGQSDKLDLVPSETESKLEELGRLSAADPRTR